MKNCLKKNFANPSSLYKNAFDSSLIIENARNTISKELNVQSNEIFFTGSASESNNWIIKSVFEKEFPNKKRIASSPIEHPAVIETLEYLRTKGAEIVYLNVDKFGFIDKEDAKQKINNDTMLVCCMIANNEIGTIQDVNYFAEIAHKEKAFFFSDCVQGFGKININLKEFNVDFASFSGHKIGGPKGIGIAYIKSGININPLIHGGHQENGNRAGTESIHNIAGFSKAVEILSKEKQNNSQTEDLRNFLIDEILKLNKEFFSNTPKKQSIPNTASITFSGYLNSVILAMFDFYGISVSAGSACNTQENKPSHVLKSIGLTDEQARNTVRFSLSNNTSFKDIKTVIKKLSNYFDDKSEGILLLSPSEINENIIVDPDIFILDVRFENERKNQAGISGSHEIVFFSFRKFFKLIPKNKKVLVICQAGINSPIVAYYLRKKGIKQVSFLMTGLWGLKKTNPGLLERITGKNITKLVISE